MKRTKHIANNKNRKPFYRFWIPAAVLVLLVAALVAYQVIGSSHGISYSDFKQYLAEGKIVSIEISDARIYGRMTDAAGGLTEKFSTSRVDDPGLISQLEANGVKYSGKSGGILPPGPIGAIVPIGIILLGTWLVFNRYGKTGGGYPSIAKSTARISTGSSSSGVTFDNVAGIDEVKEELREVVEFLKQPARFEDLGGRVPKGILLVGSPGTGKTLIAKAVSGEAGVPFFSISGSEFVEMFVGVGAARVRDLFTRAASKAPCIVFIDELDALGKARGVSPGGGNDEREQTLNQLLVAMDGFDTRKGIIVLAATNRPEILDPALLRPGRFDRQVALGSPDLVGREEILKIHTKNVKLEDSVDLKVIAARTPGFVGADLANIVNEAALLAARRGRERIGAQELGDAIERVIAGPEKRRLISPQEKTIVAYHEAGHALVGATVSDTDTVHKISIVPRGIAALGYTMNVPVEDRYLMSRRDLENRLAMLLGGRAAEELVFGDVTNGAQNDLSRATGLARAMVTEYGMSERLGLATYDRQRSAFLGKEEAPSPVKEYSETIAAAIDEEIREVLERAYTRARAVLMERRELLEKIAGVLLEKETIEQTEFARMLMEYEPV